MEPYMWEKGEVGLPVRAAEDLVDTLEAFGGKSDVFGRGSRQLLRDRRDRKEGEEGESHHTLVHPGSLKVRR